MAWFVISSGPCRSLYSPVISSFECFWGSCLHSQITGKKWGGFFRFSSMPLFWPSGVCGSDGWREQGTVECFPRPLLQLSPIISGITEFSLQFALRTGELKILSRNVEMSYKLFFFLKKNLQNQTARHLNVLSAFPCPPITTKTLYPLKWKS